MDKKGRGHFQPRLPIFYRLKYNAPGRGIRFKMHRANLFGFKARLSHLNKEFSQPAGGINGK